jgi:hypothetical protein
VASSPLSERGQESTQLSIIGGGSFTLPEGDGFTASVPLVELTADAAGVRIAVRVDQHERRFWLFALAAPKAWNQASCEFTWDELKEVKRARRGVILFSIDGRHCRFVTKRRKRLDPLVQVFDRHGIPVQTVSTFRLFFPSH